MVERIAIGLTDQMIREELISKDMKDWYIYALLRIIESILSVGTIFVISLIFDAFVPTFGFWTFFNMLRKKTGGFHCEKYWQCYLGTVMIYMMIVRFESVISSHTIALYALLSISSIIILIIGTVNHPNISWNREEAREAKRISRYILAIEIGIICFFMAIGITQIYITYMSMAVILCALLLCAAKIIRQEVRVDDEKEKG